jgi:GAF domain-containing protein/anti-sigma regulatory factor (Ser/Thr protein kinase)
VSGVREPGAGAGSAHEPHGTVPDVARVQVQLAAQAAVATPLSELEVRARDVSRIQPLLEQVLAAVVDVLGTDMAAVWVTDTVADELYAVAWTGLADDYLQGIRVAIGTGSAGRAVAQRRAVLFADIADDEGYDEYRDDAMERGIRSAFSTPMLSLSGEPMGALTAYHREPHEPTERERQLVETLAGQAGEMVERARMHAEARELAALERRRGEQLRGLADAATAVTGAQTLDDLLRLVTEAAMSIIGCHQGVATRLPHGWADQVTYVSLSEQYAAYRSYDVVPKGQGVLEYVIRENEPLRLTGEQLVSHPEWRGLRDAPGHPPLPNYLAAPLVGRDGHNLGLIQLSHKTDESPFTAEDEAIVVQLAQMASTAIDRLEALEGERTARWEAEEAARLQDLLSEASQAFAASLEPADIGDRLVRAAVPTLADIAVLHVVDEHGEPEVAAVHATTREVTRAARAWIERAPRNPDAPYGTHQVIRTGELQLLPEVTDEIIDAVVTTAEDGEALRGIVRRSAVIVPLTARGRTIGTLSLNRDEPYGEREVDYALDLARRAALGLDNASRYTFEREVAATLQRSLLPREMPASALLTSAARYLPGARGTQIGGDWYDLLEVDDGLVLVVGDVMGRGVEAASVMGQLRATVRAFALEGHSPAEVLRLLDRVVQRMAELHFTTCLVGHLDPDTRRLCLAAAGHLSPLVVGPDGVAFFLELDPGLPLGVGGAAFEEVAVELAAGSAVLLFTDGLVEEPGTSLDDGMARLRAAADGPVHSAEELCDRVLHAMGRQGGHDDDTALLALLLDDDRSRVDSETLVLELPATPESAAVARGALLELLTTHGRAELADTAALLITELVANTARHAHGEVRVRAGVRSGRLLVEVADEVENLPVLRRGPSSDQESGRGLVLVEALADRWGADPLPTGKRVWFELGGATA